MVLIGQIVHRLIQAYILVVMVEVVLSYFLSPFHPVRQFIYRLVEPALSPIRRVLPPIAGIDFSPLALMVVLQLVDMLLSNLFLR